jgi:hypothetical protein
VKAAVNLLAAIVGGLMLIGGLSALFLGLIWFLQETWR